MKEKLQATERMMKAELAALENTLDKTRRRVTELQAQQKALKVLAPAAGQAWTCRHVDRSFL